MPKAYIIVTEAIHDPAGMGEYMKAAGPTIGKSGAEIVAVDQNVSVLEGSWHGSQTIVLGFESEEAARAWYDSPEYQAAAKLRQAAADCNAVIIHGFG